MQRVCSSARTRRTCRLLAVSSFVVLQAVSFVDAQAGVTEQGQPTAAAEPVSISLEEAIHRAQVNEPAYATAVADSRTAALDRSIARAALLPGVTYHNQYLYTEGTRLSTPSAQGTSAAAQRFIANNAVHEYMSQGVVDESVGLAEVAGVRRADAAAAIAAAELEISRRGLVAAVSGLF